MRRRNEKIYSVHNTGEEKKKKFRAKCICHEKSRFNTQTLAEVKFNSLIFKTK